MVDMGIVVDVISQLENYAITKEALEATRLGKLINDLRRKASDKGNKQLASRAKSLVKKWRELLVTQPASGSATPVPPQLTQHKQTAATGPSCTPSGHQALQQKAVVQAAAVAQRLNGHHKILNTSSSQPSSRLTSPAISSSGSRISPAIHGGHHGSHPRGSSSMPSSASSSPGFSSSRPATPNHHNSRPVSPAVPKTNAANKRLRKAMEGADDDDIVILQPAAKKAKNSSKTPPLMVNGKHNYFNNHVNHHDEMSIGVNNSCDRNSNNAAGSNDVDSGEKSDVHYSNDVMANNGKSNGSNAMKKMTRKKQLEQEREHLLEQKLLTARRQASKVRTTQELVQELALRNSTANHLNKAKTSTPSIVNETKTELMNRFFDSQSNGTHHQDVLSPPLSDGPPSPSQPPLPTTSTAQAETVDDILAQLPPIDVASILAEINTEMQSEENESEDDEVEIEGLIPPIKKEERLNNNKSSKKEHLSEGVKAAMVQELHDGEHESVNGNFNHNGTFKEWHEVVSKETVNGDLLYILPYSVID